MDDEPLSDWAERRDAKIGRLRAVPITPGDGPRGAHVNPDAPRIIERWNGYSWEFYGFVASLDEAKRLLRPEVAGGPEPLKSLAPKLLGSGKGRHRKPQFPR